MNWDKVFDLDTKGLNSTINLFFTLFAAYVIFVLLSAFFKPSYLTIPLLCDVVETGVWNEEGREQFTISAKGTLDFSLNTKKQPRLFYLAILAKFIYLSIIGFILFQVKKLSESILFSQPFTIKNAFFIRRIGFSFLFLGLLYPLLTGYIEFIANKYISYPSLKLRPNIWEINWEYWFLGCLFLLIAIVFKKGIELREETELTI